MGTLRIDEERYGTTANLAAVAFLSSLFISMGFMAISIWLVLAAFQVALGAWFFQAACAYGFLKREDWAPLGGMVVSGILLVLIGLALMAAISVGASALALGLLSVYLASLLASFMLSFHARELVKEWAGERSRDLQAHPPPPGARAVGTCPVCGSEKLKFVDGVTYECRNCGNRY